MGDDGNLWAPPVVRQHAFLRIFEDARARSPGSMAAPWNHSSTTVMTHASTDRPAAVPSGRRPTSRGPREWARAFTGFYPPLAEDLVELDPIARFLYSARSVILVISFQAALLAGLLALTDRRFALVPFVLVVVGYVVLHAISNLSNDYFGARRGHDTADSPRRRYTVHPVLSGAVSSALLVRGLLVLAAVAIAIGIYF